MTTSGCRMCKALMSAPSNVHPDHIEHQDEAHHHVQCPTYPCTHYEETS